MAAAAGGIIGAWQLARVNGPVKALAWLAAGRYNGVTRRARRNETYNIGIAARNDGVKRASASGSWRKRIRTVGMAKARRRRLSVMLRSMYRCQRSYP